MKTIFSAEFAFFGVDVASRELVIARYPQTTVKAIANDTKGIKAWLKTVPADSVLAVEATGGYHHVLVNLAHAAGVHCYVLNPKDVKNYAKSTGGRAKTDGVDACLISRYIAKEHMELHRWRPAPQACTRLDRLLSRRAKLVTIRGILSQTFAGVAGFSKEINAVRAQIDRLFDTLDALIHATSHALPDGARERARLEKIPGLGLLTSSYALSLFTRLPFSKADAVIAFSGLDPRANDSGMKTGRRRLSKRGPSEMRRLFYNAAMSAARTATWNPTYQRARAAGKTTTEALVILARKLLRVAFALYKTKTEFDANKIGPASAV